MNRLEVPFQNTSHDYRLLKTTSLARRHVQGRVSLGAELLSGKSRDKFLQLNLETDQVQPHENSIFSPSFYM
jgi:hypothetical protein